MKEDNNNETVIKEYLRGTSLQGFDWTIGETEEGTFISRNKGGEAYSLHTTKDELLALHNLLTAYYAVKGGASEKKLSKDLEISLATLNFDCSENIKKYYE